jgi:hypothetical protein
MPRYARTQVSIACYVELGNRDFIGLEIDISFRGSRREY